MELIPENLEQKLLENGRVNAVNIAIDGCTEDFMPVIKLFMPFTRAIWLISEINPQYPDVLFGLCDLGLGFAEMGNLSLSELMEIEGPRGERVARDSQFIARHPLSVYAAAARKQQGITFDEELLQMAASKQKKEE